MPSLKKTVVLCAFLLAPSRLPGQATDAVAPAPVVECYPGPSSDAVFRRADPFIGRRPYFESLFIFGGEFTKASMGKSLNVFNVTDDDKYILGLGYQRFPWLVHDIYCGWEVGTASRFSGDYSHEFWFGAVIRHRGVTIADRVTATMALTAGFSMVTDTMGQEAQRVEARRGDGTFLYYLGPEIILSHPCQPNFEIFYRLHHRCGGGLSLGNLREGYNANTLGIRWKF